jgi:hypothetical protein
MQVREQRFQVDTAQGFGSNDQQAGTVLQLLAEHLQMAGDDAVETSLIEHHQRQGAVATQGRQNDRPFENGRQATHELSSLSSGLSVPM